MPAGICHYLLAPPLNLSKMASKFLQFTNYHIRVEVTGERVNGGIGLGKIPVKYFFMEIPLLRGKFCPKCSCSAQK